jgi:hypothetical protein
MAKRKRRLKPVNRKAEKLAEEARPPQPGPAGTRPDVFGMACGDCCAVFSPGWEVSAAGDVDPCPWVSDLADCHQVNCMWAAQVPDQDLYPNWLSACSNLVNDWQNLCVVPD